MVCSFGDVREDARARGDARTMARDRPIGRWFALPTPRGDRRADAGVESAKASARE